LSFLQAGFLRLNTGWNEKGTYWETNNFTKTNSTVIHVDLILIAMLKRRLEEHSLSSIFDWEVFIGFVELVSAEEVEVQIVSDAVCTHTIVTNAKRCSVWHFEYLKHQSKNFVRQHLRQTFFSEKQNQTVWGTQWVLVEQKRVKFRIYRTLHCSALLGLARLGSSFVNNYLVVKV
jgi:hypothetical protein